jgi:hypothetical protein
VRSCRAVWPVVEGGLAPANASAVAVGEELLAEVAGWVLADRNYGSPRLAEQLQAQGGWLLPTPRRVCETGDSGRRPGWSASVGGRDHDRPARRYHLKQVWARDTWHLWSRWLRKLVSHTLAVYLCQLTGLGSLRFADLLAT